MIIKMEVLSWFVASATVLMCISCAHSHAEVPYRRLPTRPKNNPYCQSDGVPFCANGRPVNTMPALGPNDTVYVYALQAPVLEDEFGGLLAKYHIMDDAIGFHHVESGANFTMQWYEINQLFNCTVPHEMSSGDLLWCNQGAACISGGIDEKRWHQNGTLAKVAEISGSTFNAFTNWTEWDNDTGVFYEPWTTRNKPDGFLWFDTWDRSSWVQRAYKTMANYGAKFNHSIKLNYTRFELYSRNPEYIGDADEIFHEFHFRRVAEEIRSFYKKFRDHQTVEELIKSLAYAIFDIVIAGEFYLYYNNAYFLVPLINPYFDITYKEVPLP